MYTGTLVHWYSHMHCLGLSSVVSPNSQVWRVAFGFAGTRPGHAEARGAPQAGVTFPFPCRGPQRHECVPPRHAVGMRSTWRRGTIADADGIGLCGIGFGERTHARFCWGMAFRQSGERGAALVASRQSPVSSPAHAPRQQSRNRLRAGATARTLGTFSSLDPLFSTATVKA